MCVCVWIGDVGKGGGWNPSFSHFSLGLNMNEMTEGRAAILDHKLRITEQGARRSLGT